jgi:hypothetical protein
MPVIASDRGERGDLNMVNKHRINEGIQILRIPMIALVHKDLALTHFYVDIVEGIDLNGLIYQPREGLGC